MNFSNGLPLLFKRQISSNRILFRAWIEEMDLKTTIEKRDIEIAALKTTIEKKRHRNCSLKEEE